MKNLLVICPTRGRPKEAKRMFDSIESTASICEIMFLIDSDDKNINEYQNLINERNYHVFSKAEYATTTSEINKMFSFLKFYDFYSVSNDDFVYKTFGWDRKLCNKGKISYGNDECARENMPTTSVIDGDIVRALGWLQMPGLKHLYGDNVWKDIGHRLNILKYFPDVIIEHRHWSNGKAQIDETYKKSNSREMFSHDERMFRDWKQNQSAQDIEKVKIRLDL